MYKGERTHRGKSRRRRRGERERLDAPHRRMALPTDTRLFYNGKESSAERDRCESLVRLLPEGRYHSERQPQRYLAAAHKVAVVALPFGWEQRIEQPKDMKAKGGHRVYFVDHATRTTTLIDPRTKARSKVGPESGSGSDESGGGADATQELLLLASGVLPEQAVSPADFRAALHCALNHSLSRLMQEGSGSTPSAGGLRERRLQLQQHIMHALLVRYLDAARTLSATERETSEADARSAKYDAFLRTHLRVAPAEPSKDVLSSLMKHAHHSDPLAQYITGLLGPKRKHIWRVHSRLDQLAPASLRNYSGGSSEWGLRTRPRMCARTHTHVTCASCAHRDFGPDVSDTHPSPPPSTPLPRAASSRPPPPSLCSLSHPFPRLPWSARRNLRLRLPTRADKLRPLSGAPDPLTSNIEATVRSLTQAATFRARDPSGDGFWSAVQSGVALTEATGSVRPLLLAVAALAQTSHPPLPQIEGAAAPGMGYRLAKLHLAFGADLAQVHASSVAVSSQLSALWDWRLLDEGFRSWREELGKDSLTASRARAPPPSPPPRALPWYRAFAAAVAYVRVATDGAVRGRGAGRGRERVGAGGKPRAAAMRPRVACAHGGCAKRTSGTHPAEVHEAPTATRRQGGARMPRIAPEHPARRPLPHAARVVHACHALLLSTLPRRS